MDVDGFIALEGLLLRCERERLLAIDLGGAHNSPPGYVVVDRATGDDALEYLEAHKGQVGLIRAVDFLEHIPIGDVVPFMNAAYQALVPAGFFVSSTPSTDGRGAFCDPTHVSFWNQLSFRYYCVEDFRKFVPEISALFHCVGVETSFPSDWHREVNVPYVSAILMKPAAESS